MDYGVTESAPQWEADLAELMAYANSRPLPHHEPGQPLAAMGLLFWPDFDLRYDDTPTEARILCWSGVDGVHWSVLPAPASPSGYVVVMTVPGAEAPNLVVGESVREFLALGCEASFFALNVLAYDESGPLDPSDYEPAVTALADLRAAFNILPWTDVPGRLAELRQRHGAPPPAVPFDQRDG
jgi:hypothetical protein